MSSSYKEFLPLLGKNEQISGESKLLLDVENLDIVLFKTEDKPLHIISVVQTSTNKSIKLLENILSHLQTLQNQGINGNNSASHTLPTSEIKIPEQNTSATWIFEDPFILKNSENEKVAVIILYTVSQSDTPAEITNALIGCNLLASSTVVVDCWRTLPKTVIQQVGLSLQYSLQVEQKSFPIPIRSLAFFIRDWSFPDEFPYGSSGGKLYLDKIFSQMTKLPEKDKILKSIDQISCLLLPYVVSSSLYSDGLSNTLELESNFQNIVSGFLDAMVENNANANQVAASDNSMATSLKSLFEYYVAATNSSGLLTAASVSENWFGNTVSAHHGSGSAADFGSTLSLDLPKNEQAFQSNNEGALKTTAFKNRNTAVEASIADYVTQYLLTNGLQNSRMVEEDDLYRSILIFIEKLTTDLKKIFKVEKTENLYIDDLNNELESSLKKECKNFIKLNLNEGTQKDEVIRSTHAYILAEYIEGLTEKLKSQKFFLNELFLNACHNQAADNSIQMLLSDNNDRSEESVKKMKNFLLEAFNKIQSEQNCEEEYLDKWLHHLFTEFEQLYLDELNQSEDDYSITIESFIAQQDERIDEILQEFKDKCLQVVQGEKLEAVLEELKDNLDNKFSDKLESFAQHLQKLESNSKLLDAQTLYKKTTSEFLKGQEWVETSDFDSHNNSILNQTYNDYIEFINIKTMPMSLALTYEGYRSTLSADIIKFKEEFSKQRRRLLYIKALVHRSFQQYQSQMTEGLASIYDCNTLMCLHDNSKQQVLSTFNESEIGKEDFQLSEMYMRQLEIDIENEFKELKEIFEMKSNASTATINAALETARKMYSEDMEKHLNNHAFLSPTELENKHKDTSERAIQICFQSNSFLNDHHKNVLQDIIDAVYHKYRQQNYMNFSMEPTIGIDLGTTYCCVATYRQGNVITIPNSIGKKTTPSYVAYCKAGTQSIGEPAKSRAYENPGETIFDAKRIIGRRFNDPVLQDDIRLWPFTVVNENEVPKILVDGIARDPEEVSGRLLKELKEDAERILQKKIVKAVVTVPAYFSDGQRQATKDAAEIAGLQVLRILNEPTAAAVAYSLQYTQGLERNVLIFDLGGGTFDVSVLKMSKGKIKALAHGGDTHLGGEDFDRNLMKYCAREFRRNHNIDLFRGKDSTEKQTKDQVRRRIKRLQGECERKKIELSSVRDVVVSIDRLYENMDLSVPVTRAIFEDLNEDLFSKTIEVVIKVLEDSEIDRSAIDDIVLVGGSTRIPKVQELLTSFFNGKALNCSINPDESVANGAAIMAAYLNGTLSSKDYKEVEDVIPMSIGVEVYGGGFSIIIPKSTVYPVSVTERFKTAYNNQTCVQITIYQGEHPIAEKNKHLGDFYLNHIPPMEAGKENIDVEMG
ncbi:Heat shock cognate 71 kDa protein [Orchesella cincta]|uniref:Heat shock cognate 71 kDa protein n=1 Tax=Orchesella cincta TaxID=48709 RepID=A0A1D2M0Y9_ORCCI|nr:Heat shock cognate 71 kDa protein [Orchesella cincta]